MVSSCVGQLPLHNEMQEINALGDDPGVKRLDVQNTSRFSSPIHSNWNPKLGLMCFEQRIVLCISEGVGKQITVRVVNPAS